MSEITITLAGSEVKAEYSGSNAWLRNDGTATVYAAKSPGITAGASGVTSIPAGQSAPVYGANGEVYLLGTGSVMLIGSDYSTNPFKTATSSGGSGVDEVARAAIGAHSGNTEIHVTAAEKSAWNALSNPNLLINPAFAVNQRGQSTYYDVGYTVDRWQLSRLSSIQTTTVGSVVPYNGGVEITSGGSKLDTYLRQYIENAESFIGKTVTLSLEVEEMNGSWAVGQYGFASMDITGVGVQQFSFEWNEQSAGVYAVQIYHTGENALSSIKIKWVKLEYGSTATPFAPPDPATELAKCKRYFTIYKHQNATSSTDKCTIGVGYALTSSIVYAVLPITAMRSGVAATVSYSGLSLINGTDTVVDFSSATALEQTDSTVQFAFAVSNQTPGTVYRLRLMNSNAYLAVSKEL